MLVYDLIAKEVVRVIEERPGGFVTANSLYIPRQEVTRVLPQQALERYNAIQQAADYADERDTQRCALI